MTAARYLGPLALCLSLAGVLMGVSIGMTGQLLERNWTMHGYGVFAAAQVAAIAVGIASRDRMGRAIACAAGVMLVVPFILMA